MMDDQQLKNDRAHALLVSILASAAFAATMTSYLVVLLSFFKEFKENTFPAHLQVRPGVWTIRKSYQVSGKRRERPSLMDGG